MRRVMDLPGWPPQSGGAFKRGDVTPESTDQVTIDHVLHATEKNVSFVCIFNGESVGYDLLVADMNTAEKVAKIIAENRGKRLFDIGFIKIPKD